MSVALSFQTPAGVSPDFLARVALGLVPGYSAVNKFGYNPDLDMGGGFEAVWGHGDDYTGHDPTAAEVVEVFSSDANDTLAGTGAQTATVYGLDAAWAEASETFDLAGATPYETSNSYIRLNRIVVEAAGSGNSNAGIITARQKDTPANILATVEIGENQSLVACYTIPDGKTGLIYRYGASLANGGNGESQVQLRVRPSGGVFQVKDLTAVIGTGSTRFDKVFCLPLALTAKTDIQVIADSSSNNAGVSAGLCILLVDD